MKPLKNENESHMDRSLPVFLHDQLYQYGTNVHILISQGGFAAFNHNESWNFID
jgi:hypothetical protein